jgi:hypothetical protein
MSAAHGRSTAPDAAVRWAVHRRLEHEVRRLRRAGVDVVRFEPRGEARRAMGLNAMADDRGPAVVRAAYFEAAERIAEPRIRRRLDPLARRRRAA